MVCTGRLTTTHKPMEERGSGGMEERREWWDGGERGVVGWRRVGSGGMEERGEWWDRGEGSGGMEDRGEWWDGGEGGVMGQRRGGW